jgi:hypothetical protein
LRLLSTLLLLLILRLLNSLLLRLLDALLWLLLLLHGRLNARSTPLLLLLGLLAPHLRLRLRLRLLNRLVPLLARLLHTPRLLLRLLLLRLLLLRLRLLLRTLGTRPLSTLLLGWMILSLRPSPLFLRLRRRAAFLLRIAMPVALWLMLPINRGHQAQNEDGGAGRFTSFHVDAPLPISLVARRAPMVETWRLGPFLLRQTVIKFNRIRGGSLPE